ncbi:DUF4259 domain-containing protein [Kitasatospora sp. NBC_01246]|uniref:DUF4259 domain-containing protein n=1 Tax=Kitasatospora sp. NBC_01246 TaxID=2903570 RepID=UPI002E365C65|nr:DUF4259 domain-containing protein [Kitasatospora sp. NBC_01246]
MGTWGSGNFDSDAAADHLGEFTARLIGEVEQAMAGDRVELEADEYWGTAVPCNLELLHLIASRHYVGAGLPAAATIEGWKADFMAVWEQSIDGLEPAPGHKEERRAVLLRTFDDLAALARELERDGLAP